MSTETQQGLLCTCCVARVLPPTRPMTRHCRCPSAGATSTTLLRLPVWWYLHPSQASFHAVHGTLTMEHRADLGTRLARSYCGGGCWTELPSGSVAGRSGQAQEAAGDDHRGTACCWGATWQHLPLWWNMQHQEGAQVQQAGTNSSAAGAPSPAVSGALRLQRAAAHGTGHLASMRKCPSFASVRGRDRMACSGHHYISGCCSLPLTRYRTLFEMQMPCALHPTLLLTSWADRFQRW